MIPRFFLEIKHRTRELWILQNFYFLEIKYIFREPIADMMAYGTHTHIYIWGGRGEREGEREGGKE